VRLRDYVQTIYDGTCPTCSRLWESISEDSLGLLAAPCGHRITTMFWEAFTREKTLSRQPDAAATHRAPDSE
jgi:hypothetical protein